MGFALLGGAMIAFTIVINGGDDLPTRRTTDQERVGAVCSEPGSWMGLVLLLVPINAVAAGAVAVALLVVAVLILSVELIRGIRSFPQGVEADR